MTMIGLEERRIDFELHAAAKAASANKLCHLAEYDILSPAAKSAPFCAANCHDRIECQLMPMPVAILNMGKPFRGPSFCLRRLDLTIARGRIRNQGFEQMMRYVRDFIDRAIESRFIGL